MSLSQDGPWNKGKQRSAEKQGLVVADGPVYDRFLLEVQEPNAGETQVLGIPSRVMGYSPDLVP
jgi:hypothetical protein